MTSTSASSIAPPKRLSRTIELPYSGEEVRAEKARRSLETFVREAWHTVESGTDYHSNWHIGAICYHLEAVTDGEIQNLLINIPPGFAKSLIVSVMWPAWEWGPKGLAHLRYVAAANNLSLAIRDTKRSRDLILSEWYQRHYGDAFRLEDDQNQKLRYQNDHKGYRVAKGIGSGTGERGNRVIFDDPHELDDAFHPEALKAAVGYNNVTLDSRLAAREHDTKVVVQQRVSTNDVTGDILRKMEQGGKHYEVLCLPMRHDPVYQMQVGARNKLGWKDPRPEPGDLLDPVRYSEESVKQDEVTYGSRAPAILAQKPRQSAATVFEREWWDGKNRYRIDDSTRQVVGRWLTLDLAMKDKETSSYNALAVLELSNPGYFLDLRHVWRERSSFPRLQPKIEPMCRRWNYDGKLRGLVIEDKAHGITAVQTIQEGVDDWLKDLLTAFNPGVASKQQRWEQAASWGELDCLRLPEPGYPLHTREEVGDLYDFEEELYDLPASTYKDWADAYSQGVIFLEHLVASGYRTRLASGPAA